MPLATGKPEPDLRLWRGQLSGWGQWVIMEAGMREHSDVATRAPCGACAVSGACLAGGVSLLLGGTCLAYAFVVPGLFGAVGAAVVAAERLLCAARSSTTKAAVTWT